MNIEKFTTKFQQAIAEAQSLALGKEQQYIDPLHLMLALLNQQGGSVQPLLVSCGINAAQLKNKINSEIDRLAKVEGNSGDVQISQSLVRLLNRCDQLAQQRQDKFISSELFVLAALEEKSDKPGPVKPFRSYYDKDGDAR